MNNSFRETGLFLLATLTVQVLATAAPSVTVDPHLNLKLGTSDGIVQSAIELSDGKLLFAGGFRGANGVPRYGLARFHPNGELDESFTLQGTYPGFPGPLYDDSPSVFLVPGPDNTANFCVVINPYRTSATSSFFSIGSTGESTTTFVASTICGTVEELVAQADGGILVRGGCLEGGGTTRNIFIRLLPNGAVDPTFRPDAKLVVSHFFPQPDGKVLYSGRRMDELVIGRLNTNGSEDESFKAALPPADPDIFGYQPDPFLVPLADGRALLAVPGGLSGGLQAFIRFNSDGSIDETFSLDINGRIHEVRRQSDGKVLLIANGSEGTIYRADGTETLVVRLLPDGTLDPSYAWGVLLSSIVSSGYPQDWAHTAVLQADGRLVIAGRFQFLDPVREREAGPLASRIVRLLADGNVDEAFHPMIGDVGAISSVVPLAGGDLVVGGYFETINGVRRTAVARLHPDGTVVPSFAPVLSNEGSYLSVEQISQQSDGKLLISGIFAAVNEHRAKNVTRLRLDGSPDVDFTTNVALDSSFNVWEFALAPDGNSYFSGSSGPPAYEQGLVRYNADGSRDLTFAPAPGFGLTNAIGFNVQLRTFAVQSDGRVIVGAEDQWSYRLMRLNLDGKVDPTFQPPDFGRTFIYPIAIYPDGKLLIARTLQTGNGTYTVGLSRLQTNGSLDSTFRSGSGPTSTSAVGFNIHRMSIGADGKALVMGSFNAFDGIPRTGLLRLNLDGTVDTTFNVNFGKDVNGNDAYIDFIQFDADGKGFIGGAFTEIEGRTRYNFAGLYLAPAQLRPFFASSLPAASNGGFSMILKGEPNRSYTVEASSDLLNWQDVEASSSSDGVIQLRIPLAGASPTRFFRARLTTP